MRGYHAADLRLSFCICKNHMSHVVRKLAFCICERKDADQLRGNREADQRLCFRYMDSIIRLLSKFPASTHLLWLYSPVCVGPGRKPRRRFSHNEAHMSLVARKAFALNPSQPPQIQRQRNFSKRNLRDKLRLWWCWGQDEGRWGLYSDYLVSCKTLPSMR